MTDANMTTRGAPAGQREPVEVVCDYCKGRGYHHGFGEGGHDPDWCIRCGGIGRWEEFEGELDSGVDGDGTDPC